MKTRALLLLGAMLALAACSNDDNETTPNEPTPTEPAQPITFNLTATHPNDVATTRGGDSGGWRWQSWDDEPAGKATPAMTRAVKQSWEAGDAIFVFFTSDDYYSRVTVPRHLKMTYDGEKWNSVEYDGPTASPGVLSVHLITHPTGTMTAVYLPYGSNATVSAAGEEDQYGRYHTFAFSETHYAYYMTATLPYEVIDNTVSGAFDMKIPDDYVQFFVKDGGASEYEPCQLGIDTVIPVGLVSVGDDGTITETSDKMASDDLPGFVYDDGNERGYHFYGKLNPYYNSLYRPYPQYEDVHKGHYFAKTKTIPYFTKRYDYFVRDKTLASHDAIKLPDANDINRFIHGSFNGGKWLEVGENLSVKLQNGTTDLGTWYTCNCNESVPESYVELYTWDEATSRFAGSGLPSPAQFQPLIDNCTWTWVKLHDRPGVVVKSDTGFLFLPTHDETGGYYWTNEPVDDERSYTLLINGHDSETWRFVRVNHQEYRSIHFPVRCMVP